MAARPTRKGGLRLGPAVLAPGLPGGRRAASSSPASTSSGYANKNCGWGAAGVAAGRVITAKSAAGFALLQPVLGVAPGGGVRGPQTRLDDKLSSFVAATFRDCLAGRMWLQASRGSP